MSEEQKKLLEKQLWAIANLLRGKMDADDYRNYILGFIFFKYLSEKLHIYADEILEPDNITYEQIDENSDNGKLFINAVKKACVKNLGYFLKPSELFTSIAQKGNNLTTIETNDNDEATQFFIIEDLERILNNIEQSTMGTESEDDFIRLFEDLDLTSSKLGKTVKAKNEIIAKIITHLDEIDFQLKDSESDLLGDAYEYLIGEFASNAGKKAGEFYTPQEVSTILAKIVTTRKKRIKSVYDPTCGSGSLLLRVAKEVDDVGHFYGQELNRTTYNLARMNMILHDVHYSKFDIKQEDTLEEPQHLDIDLKAEAIVANPPFSAKWSAKSIFSTDDRFSQYGKLAPKTKADFAFVQHMIHHLDENGIMATVVPHGVLFRGSAEAHIRRYLIEDRNYIDAVIGLPANIFFGTGIPTCILVVKKCREVNEDVLFIDAGMEFLKKGNQNKLLKKHINKIIDTYTDRKVIKKFSYRASLEEIAENDYNLNIPRYVDTFIEDEIVNIESIFNQLKKLNDISIKNDNNIKRYCEILNIPFPDGNNVYLLKKFKKWLLKRIFNQDIRFKTTNNLDFPEWQIKKLGELCIIKGRIGYRGYTVADIVNKGEGAITLSPSNISDGYLHYNNSTYISWYKYNESPEIQIENGDILLVKTASVGKTAIVKNLTEPATINPQIVVLKNVKINSEFLAHQIYSNYVQRQIVSAVGLGAIPNLSQESISKFKIKVPCKEEQVLIADFLSLINEKINLLNSKAK